MGQGIEKEQALGVGIEVFVRVPVLRCCEPWEEEDVTNSRREISEVTQLFETLEYQPN